MPLCANCGQENPEIARFCLACAAPLESEAPQGREVRKTVTIVFSDLIGSTALGERFDPELLRRVMSRYFEEMRVVVERHGGTVEKFIGDAVMAVFGIPEVHEDDAMRAVRAATEMRRAQTRLNEEFDRFGVRLAVRTGVNTGEVVAGDPSKGQSFATGDAVNVAARLEQAAKPGEILIGQATHRLVRDEVTVEPVEPLSLKGKSQPVPAWRLVEVVAQMVGARRLASPLVGRERELAVLRQSLDRTSSEGRCHLVTVLGSAGAGKSRLASELTASVNDRAWVLEGRCLSYGVGITFWPIAEIVKAAARIQEGDSAKDAEQKIAGLLGDERDARLIAERVAAVTGFAEAAGSQQETFWALRRLLEALGRERPLLIVLDDIHWAEPGLLDLIEYMVGWSSGAPILLLCLARQDLLELRPSLATPKPNAISVLLEPLSPDESNALIEGLLGSAGLTDDARGRISAAAEGNPLFVEELLQVLIDDGFLGRRNGTWVATLDLAGLAIPPTIHALLAARLDRLDDGERDVIQRAAIVGKGFWWSAVEELSPARERAAVGARLQSLVRRELIRPDASTFVGEDAFQFGHILIRDVAYQATPKQLRAELHERFAGWLEVKTGERAVEYEEIVGYHLAEAFGYRSELGPLGKDGSDLGARAGIRLASAGRRALVRGDVAAASKLLGRALELLPDEAPTRIELLLDLGDALRSTGEFPRAMDVLGAAVQSAERAGDRRLEAHARIQQLLLRSDTDPNLGMSAVLEVSELAFQVFEEFGDELGFARTWRATAEVHLTACQWGASAAALERALVHAQRAAHQGEVTGILNHLANSLFWGPTPVAEGVARCATILQQAKGQPIAEANVSCFLAGFEAMRGNFERARALYARGGAIFQELGHGFGLAAHTLLSGTVELLAGDAIAAEREFRRGYEVLTEMGETGVRSAAAAFLGESLYVQGRLNDAERFTEVSRDAASAEDAAAQIAWRITQAKILAGRSDGIAAEALARDAVSLAAATDFINMQGDASMALAETLRLSGRVDETTARLEEGIALYEQKGNLVSARHARALLTEAASVS